MSDWSPTSEPDELAVRPREARRDVSAPDWVFSAVIHVLLIALLFTSKAGPGGGKGIGPGGGGPEAFGGDRWIEAQLADESAGTLTVSAAVEAVTENSVVDMAVQPTEPAVVPASVDSQNAASDDSIVNASHAEQIESSRQSRATAGTPDGGGSAFPDRGENSGTPGARGRGDGTPGDGGTGQGGTSLFGIWDRGERFVYIIDRSSSMQEHEKLAAARRELEASLSQLDESIEFQVLFYNQEVQPLKVRGSRGLIRASRVNRNRAMSQIRLVTAEGGTRHRSVLEAALRLRPTVIYFLTDAEDGLEPGEIAALAQGVAGETRIHCIQFGNTPGESPTADNWLAQLAAATGGESVHVGTATLQTADGESPDGR